MDTQVDRFKIPYLVEAENVFPEGSRVIVIGSGFGGLAAAIRLAVKGYEVTVLEKLDAPGGRAYVHHRNGYTFDAGPTIITAPFLLEELWQLCGKSMADDIDLRLMDPFYQVRFNDGRILITPVILKKCGTKWPNFLQRIYPAMSDFYKKQKNAIA
jgi:phytoene desaturase